MENLDLLKSQIHSSCRLALPEGLNDLMWDISREVLRAQPQNLCSFIADYLAVLLVARENLHVAAHVCIDVCEGICHALLEDELRNFGFSEDVALEAKNVIQNCFERNEVNEAKIMLELLKLADIDEHHLPAIQNAIRSAFLRHQANRNVINLSSSSDDDDDVTRAARHTLNLFRQTRPATEEMNKAAVTVQTAYRAYGVRRKTNKEKQPKEKKDTASKTTKGKFITFHNEELCNSVTAALSQVDDASEKTEDIYVSQPKSELLHTASSISLAGSYLQLPMYKPYCPHDAETLHEMDERTEKEHTMVDYTLEPDKIPRIKKISFHKLEVIEHDANKSEGFIEEMIEYDEVYEATESVGEELLKTTDDLIDVQDYIEERIEVEKTNDTSDYSNVDSEHENEELHPIKGMDIEEIHPIKEMDIDSDSVEMTSEHRDTKERIIVEKANDTTDYSNVDSEHKNEEVHPIKGMDIKEVHPIKEMEMESDSVEMASEHRYTKERIEVEKANDTSDYNNVDQKNKNEEIHPIKGMEMTSEHRDSDETSVNFEETISTEYMIYDAYDNYDDKDSDFEGYPDGTVKHVNSVQDMNFDAVNLNEDNINDMNEVIHQIDDMMF